MNADSEPDLDDWGIDDYWTCSDWIDWYYMNKNRYGKATAVDKFFHYWEQQTIGAHALDCRTFNQDFRDFQQREGIQDRIMDGLGIFYVPIQAYGAAGDVVTTATTQISNARKYVLPVAAVLLIAAVTYRVTRK